MVKSNQKISKLLVIGLIALFISGMSFILLIIPSGGQGADKKNLLVISKGTDSHFRQSIQVDQDNFDITIVSDLTPITSIDPSVDIIVLFDASLDTSEISLIGNFVDSGGSCIIFMGQNLHNDATLLEDFQIIITDANFQKNSESNLFVVGDISHPISQNIDWNSAPDMIIGNMTVIPTQDFNNSIDRVIDVYPASKNLEIDLYRQPILVEMAKGNGNILLFTGWVEEGANIHFVLWPYFNYLLYTMAFESIGEQYQKYSQWAFSPVPHLRDQIIILIVVICLAILAVSLFVMMRKKSESKMDQATIETLRLQAEEEERKRREEEEELKGKIEAKIDLKDDWEVIGIHRQLGGFLFTLFISLILVIPQLLISSFVMPQIIQPYPQAAGWYYYAYNIFQIAWLVFDLGTSFALAKYFAQYRVKNPEKAVHYIQIFVWWQLLTGLIQVCIFAFIGSIIFPMTNIAHMSWIFVTFSLVQYPGFFLVFMYTFQGMQKADLHLITYVAWEVIWLLVGQMIFCYLGRMWGAANPIIGEALGAGIGYAIARYFDYWVTFLFSMILFKKQGFSVKTVFRIDFTKDEFNESIKYGSKLAFGESFVQIGWFIQIIVTSMFIANYSNELGYFNLCWGIGMIVQIVALYAQSLLGAYSESYEHGKPTLTRLYIYQGFRWANYFAFFIVSVLFAIGAKFIVGAAGIEYGGPAVKFLYPLLIFHTFGVFCWLGDAILEGTGKTGLAAFVWIMEQTSRAILIIILVIWLKNMEAVLFAYIPAVILKGILLWIIVRYKITTYKVYPFKTFLVPALAAIVNFLVLSIVGDLIWMIPLGDLIINTAILFIIGIFGFIFFYAFLDGLFGGYDDNTINELERAANLVEGAIGVFPKALYKMAKLGTKISPFHNKFKIDIYEKAMQEALELTLEKKVLKI
ncbi:MAG: oligosaccharide flippase family protein [Candidatus Lokiarchaeota archaeon]|nr:oligosaccharide flippase family protein [Candidatus Lokiarchaeota archaeon]